MTEEKRSIGDGLDELEELDRPRGVVYAANLYAQEKVGLAGLLLGCARQNELAVLDQARVEHSKYWDAFHAGAQWGNRTGLERAAKLFVPAFPGAIITIESAAKLIREIDPSKEGM